MKQERPWEIPSSWSWSNIGEATDYVQRGKSPKYIDRSDLPVINQRCIRWEGVEPEHLKFVDPIQWPAWSEERFVRRGDVLWNSTGTGTIGRAAIFRPSPELSRAVVDSHVTILRTNQIEAEYLYFWIRSPRIQGQIDAMQSGSTNQVELGRAQVLSTEIPIAPRPEQRRIVAKIEALMARSRKAREALEQIPALLELYRQSVLAAAFRGELTQDWRLHVRKDESAQFLISKMASERKERWIERNRDRSYRPPEPLVEEELPEIPPTWVWTNFDHLSWEITVGHVGPMKDRYVDNGIPFLRSQNVRPSGFDSSGMVRIPPDFHGRLSKSRLVGGEILVVRSGANTGDCCVYPQEAGEANCSDLVITRPLTGLDPDYGALYVQSPAGQVHLAQQQTGVAQAHFNIGAMKVKPFPLPPKSEQREIVSRVKQLLSACASMEDACRTTSVLEASLSASILAKAFRGELVPQDSTDEPAEALLARIRAERESAGLAVRRPPAPKSASPSKATKATIAITASVAPLPTSPVVQPASLEVDAVLPAFRQAFAAQAHWEGDEALLRAVAQRLGHQRLGSRIHETLKGHLRAALLRRIVERRDDGNLGPGPRTLDAYTRDELIAFIPSVLRKGQTATRDDLMRALLHHLAFQRLTEPVHEALRSAFNAAIRRGVLETVGADSVRRQA